MPPVRLAAALSLTASFVVPTALAGGESPDADPPITWVTRPATDLGEVFSTGIALPGPTAARGASAPFYFTGQAPEGDAPSSVVYSPDGAKIVIAHRESRNLIVWDALTLAFVGEAPVSGAAQSVAITPDSTTAVVANVDNDTVSFVDMATLIEIGNIPAGQNPGVIKVSPAGDVAAVSDTFNSRLVVIDIATQSVVQTVAGVGYSVTFSFQIEAPATGLEFSEFHFVDADRVINLDRFAEEAQIINVRTGVVTRLAVAPQGQDVAVSADGSLAAISHGGAERKITLIDLSTETVSAVVPTTYDLFGDLTLNNDGSKAVVSVLNAARVVDLPSGASGPELSTASLNDLRTTADGLYAVGIGFRGPIIQFSTGTMVAQMNNVVSTSIGDVSPTASQVAMCSTTFGDDLVVASTNGGASSLQSFQLSGPPPEGDRCRTGAMSDDASTAVGVSIFSDTLTIIDADTGAVTGFAPLGMRPSGVAITPDGSTAVVANLDSTFASVVDLATATTTNVNISTRGSQVEISPDGQYAYVPVVASGDGVWRINLNTNTVDGPKLITGNMGGVGYSYSQSSGMALSPDGSVLAVAGSFDDVVTFINTATWSVINSVTTNDFPAWVAFSPDSQTCYAAVKNTDQVAVIDVSGALPALTTHISVGDQPWHMIDMGDGRLLVHNWGDAALGIVNLTTGVQAGVIPLPDFCTGVHYDAGSGLIYAANGAPTTTLGGPDGYSHTESGRVSVINATTLAIVDTIDIGVGPSQMSFAASGTRAILPAPTADGAVVLSLPTPSCNEADLAEPFGTLDFSDVIAFLSAFGAMDPAADLAPPFGTFDFSDVLAFLSAFGAGCS